MSRKEVFSPLRYISGNAQGSLGGKSQPHKAGGGKPDNKILSLDVFEWSALRHGSRRQRNSFCVMTESEMAFSRVGISRPMMVT